MAGRKPEFRVLLCRYLAASFGVSHLLYHGPSQLLGLYNEWVFWGISLASSGSRPHFCQYQAFSHTFAWSGMGVLCVNMCPRALATAEAFLCGATRCPPCRCCLSALSCGWRSGAQLAPGWPRAPRLVAVQSPATPPSLLFFWPFVLSYIPALNSLLAKRSFSISREMPTKPFWYFLSPQLSRSLWRYCDSKALRLQVRRFS